jgi:autotransporter adhesin
VNQLNQGLANIENQLNAGLGALQQQVSNNYKSANAGTAMGLSASNLRYDDRPGKLSASAATGYYRGQVALAIGFGQTSEDGRWRFNVSGSAAPTLRKPELAVGAGVSYTLN